MSMTDRELLEYLARHFVVKSGPKAATNQYGELELWWAANSVHEEPDAGRNPWMMLGHAGNSFNLAAMGELQALIRRAHLNGAGQPPR